MRLARSGTLLAFAHFFELAMPLLRNVVLARLLDPREFALAVTLGTIVGIAELATDVGLAQLAVRTDLSDRDGRGTLHVLAASRAMLGGGLIAVLAVPLSMLFDAPGSAMAFALVGLAMALRGFSDLAYKQRSRSYDWSAEAVLIIGSQLAWTVALIAFCLVWRDYRAAVAGLLVYAASFVAITHALSPMPYRFAWRPRQLREARDFGRPLLANGVFLAVTSLSDRMVVGAFVGLEALALYGPLTTTALVPRGAALRFFYNLFLPATVNAVERREDPSRSVRGWIDVISFLAVAFALGFMSLATPVIALTFGERYAPTATLASCMGLLLFCRFVAAYPVPIAVATGRTWFVTGSSALSAVSLLPASLSLSFFHGANFADRLSVFLGVMTAVEMLGAFVITLRTARAFPAARNLVRSATTATLLACGPIIACYAMNLESWTTRLPLAALGILAAGAFFNQPFREVLSQRKRQSNTG